MRILIIVLAMCVTGCANHKVKRGHRSFCNVDKIDRVSTITCVDGSQIVIEDGSDGFDSALLTTVITGTVGGCYQLTDELWVENEGNHIDVYNNADCDHSPAPKAALCNNVYQQEICAVDNKLFYIEGTYEKMVTNMLEFAQ